MIEVAALLEAVSPDSPCGENLEYDPVFAQMERSAIRKPDQQFGKTIVPAEEPNWKDVGKCAQDLVKRTKDLRVAVYLARAEVVQSGWPAFAAVMELIVGYVKQYWEGVHPQLDPDDDNDPVLRVNILESLCDGDATLRLIKQFPVVSSRTVGRFNLRDFAIADGELKAPEGTEAADWSKINAAFMDSAVEELTANSVAVRSTLDHLDGIQKTITEHVGAGASVNLDSLKSLFKTVDKVYSEQLKKRGVNLDAPAAGAAAEATVGADGVVVVGAAAGQIVQKLAGEITSREDVVTALDKICDYYAKSEPSSPLPLLISRCKRLVSASFLEIIREVIPDAMDQAEAIGGRKEEKSDE